MTNDDHPATTPGHDDRTTGQDRLWTPWRMRYVGGNATETGCIFCNRLEADDDVRSLILHRNEQVFVIMNLFPYNTGHLMIVPNAHVATPETADDDTLGSVGQMLRPTLRALRRALACDGFNVGFNVGTVAGAGVADHLHQHVVPRWTGDANFLPILASTMVLPELIPVTYAKVRAELIREFATDGTSRPVPLVVLDAAAKRVLIQTVDAGEILPTVSPREDQSIARAAAAFLGEREIEAVLAGWAGPARADTDGSPALAFVMEGSPPPDRRLRFMATDEATAHLERPEDRDAVERAIQHLSPPFP